MFAVDVFMTFIIFFACFGSHYVTEGLVAGAAAALILVLSQKIKYVGTILITIQGIVMSIVLATELVSPQVHKSIYTWTAALVLFVIYMMMNHETIGDNIDGYVIEIETIIETVITIVTFPFCLIRSILRHIINTFRKCFVQIARLFTAIKRLFRGKAKEKDSAKDQYEQARREQEERFRNEQTRREQAAREQRNTSNISYFQNCSSRSELVRAYRKWVKELHPDNGGNPEDFIRMSNEYDRLKTRYAC